jgi:hypothetical protein
MQDYNEIIFKIKQFEIDFLNQFKIKAFVFFQDNNGQLFSDYKNVVSFTFYTTCHEKKVLFITRYFRNVDRFIVLPQIQGINRACNEETVASILIEKNIKLHEIESFIKQNLLNRDFFDQVDKFVDDLNNLKKNNRNLF